MLFFSKKSRGFTFYLLQRKKRKVCLTLSKKDKGFSLIEVLVVVAIIGILSAITLGAIDQYQSKANDTAIGANLSQIRKVAVMIYTSEYSYNSICDDTDNTLNDTFEDYPELETIEVGVKRLNNDEDVRCFAKKNIYCVRSPLSSDENRYFCVDSTGFAGEIDEEYCKDKDGERKCSAP